MVFQHPNLLPWRTVLGNVCYSLQLQHRLNAASKQHALDLVQLVGLRGFEDAYPKELSGGMQQRVNLARALVVDPEMLLLDEPFGALDAQTREVMQAELLRIWGNARSTALFITHDIKEAIYLADRVVVFSARPGRILDTLKVDLPRPRSLHVKREPRFLEYEDHIWSYIEREVNRTQQQEREARQHGGGA